MEDARSLAAIDTAERFADGLATTEELAAAWAAETNEQAEQAAYLRKLSQCFD